MSLDAVPHRRFNPLTGDWVLVSPQRATLPWQGQTGPTHTDRVSAHDPECYLCPGNARTGDAVNPVYTGVYVFSNDFPAVLPDSNGHAQRGAMFRSEPAVGTSDVICFSERHDLHLGDLARSDVLAVVEAWVDLTAQRLDRHRVVQIFENRGQMMGASNPHPHGQAWSLGHVPTQVAREDRRQAEFRTQTGELLLTAYVQEELRRQDRLVVEDTDWAVLVPYWAIWPFETLVVPRRPVTRLTALSAAERDSLAGVLKTLIGLYDAVFDVPFPYSMGWHQQPAGGTDAWVLHAHFNPSLLRSATVQKFMVGFEMFGEPQRDLTAEAAAERLRLAKDRYAARV